MIDPGCQCDASMFVSKLIPFSVCSGPRLMSLDCIFLFDFAEWLFAGCYAYRSEERLLRVSCLVNGTFKRVSANVDVMVGVCHD